MKTALPFAAFLLVLAVTAGWIVRQGETMPPRIASHFDIAGKPNGWMESRAEARLFAAIAVGTAAFVALIGYAIRFFPPSTLHVPHAAYWRAPGNHPRACRFLFPTLLAYGAFIALWLAALHGLVAAANRRTPVALDGHDMTVLMAVFALGTAAWIAWLFAYFAKPR